MANEPVPEDSGGGRRGGAIVSFRGADGPPPVEYVRPEELEPVEQGFDFWAAFKVIARRKWLILAVVIAGLAGATIYTLTRTYMYRASASMEIQKEETQIVEGSGVQPAVIADDQYMVTQLALLKSRSLAERVAETLDLPADKRYADQKLSRDQRLRRSVEYLQKHLTVEPVARSRVINVAFTSPYASESARVTNAFAEGFIESNLERKFNATSYARSFLEDRLKSTKEALETSERKLVEYARDNKLIDLGTGKAAEVGESLDASSLVALNSAKTQAENDRIAAEHKFIEARDSPSALQTLNSETITQLKNARAALAAEYQEKLATFKPDYPDMVDKKARIDGLDAQIAAERKNIVQALEADFKSAKAREDSLNTRVSQLGGSLQTERDTRIDYNILHREVDTSRSLYEALLQRLKEVSIASGVGSSQVAIVDRAQAPRLPYSPDIRANLLRALALSLALALALAFALDHIDDTIKSPEDVKAKLGLPCIGVVPKVGNDLDVTLEMRDPRSRVTEAFSSVRTALQFSTPNGAPLSLLITGTRPAEGKTSAAVGLALSFASIGQRVLIIDADMRKPSFESPRGPIGLSKLLTGDSVLAEHIIAGEAPNLFLLPSGMIPPNPAELLASSRLRNIIAEAERQFDLVIVDAPPVLNFADALLLGAVCDGTIMIAQTGAIRRPAAQRTLDRLRESRTTILGVLLSKFDAKRVGYGYGYGYGYEDTHNYGEGRDGRGEAAAQRRIGLFAGGKQYSDPNSLS